MPESKGEALVDQSPTIQAPGLDCAGDGNAAHFSVFTLHLSVVTIIDLLPITIIDGSRGLHTAEVPAASSLYSGLSFRSPLSLGGGTGNAPLISLRPSLITDDHFVSTLNDLAQTSHHAPGNPASGCQTDKHCARL
jgi:hypothetical protein